MGGFKITGLGVGTVGTDAVRLSQLQAGTAQLLAVSGTDTLTALGTPTLTAYATGNLFYFVAAATNTTSVTLNVDGLGARSVTRHGSTALVAGDILAGEVCLVVYDGTRFQLLNPGSYTNLNVSGNLTLNAGTVNGVAYLNASRVVTSGSALVFDGANLALNTTSPAHGSSERSIDIGPQVSFGRQSDSALVANYNVFLNASAQYIYRTSNFASRYEQLSGQHKFYTAASGTAGNVITFTQAMTLDASGNLGIGTSSPALYSGYTTLAINNATNGGLIDLLTNGTRVFTMYAGSTSVLGTVNSSNLALHTVGVERVRLDINGNLGIGTSSPGYPLSVFNAALGVVSVKGGSSTNQGSMFRVESAGATSTFAAFGDRARIFGGTPDAEASVFTGSASLFFDIAGTERGSITASGNFCAGARAVVGTSATNGFLYVPTCAGTPTGTPTGITGMAPIIVNTTNNKLYFYSGGAWRDAGP
jgi:hypothetical protein